MLVMASENRELKKLEMLDYSIGFSAVVKKCSKRLTACISSTMTSQLDLEHSYSADPAAR